MGNLTDSRSNSANKIRLAQSPISHLTSTFSSARNEGNRGLISRTE